MKEKLIQYFIENNFKAIRDTGKTWQELGSEFGLTGESARKIIKRSKAILTKKIELTKAIEKHVEKNKFQPKILIFDLETAPLRAYVWRLWKQNVHPLNGQLQSEWFLLTYSAKWLFDSKVYSGKLTPEEVTSEDDTRLVKEMWDLFNEADIVIAHNGIQFDVPMMNGRFLKKNLPPPLPYKIIDTKKVAAKQFNLPSNKLDYIAQFLGLGRKIDTDFELWVNCLKGDTKALSDMELYNIQDVRILEDVYLALRPYIQPHPNLGLYITEDTECCPSCTSTELKWEGNYTTYSNTYKAFRCNHCGSIGRSKTPEKKHSNLTKPCPI